MSTISIKIATIRVVRPPSMSLNKNNFEMMFDTIEINIYVRKTNPRYDMFSIPTNPNFPKTPINNVSTIPFKKT